MSMSTNESVSIGLAHEVILALTRRGVTTEQFTSMVQNTNRITDRVVDLLSNRSSATTITSVVTSGPSRIPGDMPLLAIWNDDEAATYVVGDDSRIIRRCLNPLSRSVVNVLYRRGIRTEDPVTINDLLSVSETELRSQGRNIGPKTLADTRAWLAYNNFPALRRF